MAREPLKAHGSVKHEEDIAAEAMRDIYGNVTGARQSWRDHDMRYVLQRILRAIKEAKRAVAVAVLLISPAAQAQDRVVDYLQAGWDIKAATEGPPRVLVLQKGGEARWCAMREAAVPVSVKGVPQLLTASCLTVR